MVDGVSATQQPRSVSRRLAGRGAWLALSPLYHHGKRLKLIRRRCARLWFVLRVRLAALLVRASVALELDPEADLSGAVRLDVWYGTHTIVRLGPGARVRRDVLLSLRGGTLVLGKDVEVRRMATLQVGGELTVGDGATLSTGVVVHCAESVRIDELTIIGEFTTLTDSAHLRTAPGDPIHHASRTKPVAIGSNVWIGAHAIIASGVAIGDLAFIGGGAVVLNEAPAGWLTAGNPARPIRELTTDRGQQPATE